MVKRYQETLHLERRRPGAVVGLEPPVHRLAGEHARPVWGVRLGHQLFWPPRNRHKDFLEHWEIAMRPASVEVMGRSMATEVITGLRAAKARCRAVHASMTWVLIYSFLDHDPERDERPGRASWPSRGQAGTRWWGGSPVLAARCSGGQGRVAAAAWILPRAGDGVAVLAEGAFVVSRGVPLAHPDGERVALISWDGRARQPRANPKPIPRGCSCPTF